MATFRTAPRPPALMRSTTRTRTVFVAGRIWSATCSPLEMLGYDQLRDSRVHGAPQVRARDLRSRPS